MHYLDDLEVDTCKHLIRRQGCLGTPTLPVKKRQNRPNLFLQNYRKDGNIPVFKNFIKILYKQNTSMIINNGYLSPQVSLQGGLRQGSPVSPPLYVMQEQVIATHINQNEDIIGLWAFFIHAQISRLLLNSKYFNYLVIN